MTPWDTGTGPPKFGETVDPERMLRMHDGPTLHRLGALIDRLDPDRVIGAADPVLAARARSEA